MIQSAVIIMWWEAIKEIILSWFIRIRTLLFLWDDINDDVPCLSAASTVLLLIPGHVDHNFDLLTQIIKSCLDSDVYRVTLISPEMDSSIKIWNHLNKDQSRDSMRFFTLQLDYSSHGDMDRLAQTLHKTNHMSTRRKNHLRFNKIILVTDPSDTTPETVSNVCRLMKIMNENQILSDRPVFLQVTTGFSCDPNQRMSAQKLDCDFLSIKEIFVGPTFSYMMEPKCRSSLRLKLMFALRFLISIHPVIVVRKIMKTLESG